jgi:hypothetical protein
MIFPTFEVRCRGTSLRSVVWSMAEIATPSGSPTFGGSWVCLTETNPIHPRSWPLLTGWARSTRSNTTGIGCRPAATAVRCAFLASRLRLEHSLSGYRRRPPTCVPRWAATDRHGLAWAARPQKATNIRGLGGRKRASVGGSIADTSSGTPMGNLWPTSIPAEARHAKMLAKDEAR